ncbi:phytase [Fulvivirgaceae bacterium BMA10]|uniref:Phytase n=1 Tax=Splendidivirga corallicola TaxID=3051826 RepID=A0ABT8KI11_9BACT|nr:phytase [Fulvivirgaceae bacterium BMA10]
MKNKNTHLHKLLNFNTSIFRHFTVYFIMVGLFTVACQSDKKQNLAASAADQGEVVLKPIFITEPSLNDTDDPAIWINSKDPSKSLIIGTDKGEENGGLYVYDLKGKIQKDKTVLGLKRPNNVDVEYGLILGGDTIDIAVATERGRNAIRVFKLPEMEAIDGGGITVFEGEQQRLPMGIALYKRPSDGSIFAFVGRKEGPVDGYLWQYQLQDSGNGQVSASKVKAIGKYSGIKEIEAIAVDDELGYLYYSDENVGVRKYYADPDSSNVELALFATDGFTDDHEGISIYKVNEKTGYILVSDQQANKFHLFPREGSKNNPHQHTLIQIVNTSTIESDGSETTSVNLGPDFPQGMFVAMSDDRTFQIYRWEDLMSK